MREPIQNYSTVTQRLSAIEARVSTQEREIERSIRGDNFTAKIVLSIFAGLVGVGGLIVPISSFVTVRKNEDRFEKELEKQKIASTALARETEIKIKKLIDNSQIKSAVIHGLNAESGTIVARPEVRKYKLENTSQFFYELKFTFYGEAKIEGAGTGKIIGFSNKYSGKFLDIITKNVDGRTDSYRYLVNSRRYNQYINPILFVAHTPSVLTWSVDMRHKKCADAFSLISEMRKEKDIGSVAATPILEFSQTQAQPEELKIIIDDIFPTFTCEELEEKNHNGKEVTPSNSQSPQPNTASDDKIKTKTNLTGE